MKKTYQKPEMAVEYFELTQSIATCSTKINFTDSECVKRDDDSTNQMKDLAWEGFFNEGSCVDYPIGMDEFDSICYHTNANAAFSS